MARDDANAVAMAAVKALLSGAVPATLDVDGHRVKLTPQRLPDPPWPHALAGLDPDRDGPWPGPLVVQSEWDGGSARLDVNLHYWGAGQQSRYAGLVGLRVLVADKAEELIWITLAQLVKDAADGAEIPVPGHATAIRRGEESEEFVRGMRADLQARLKRSGMQMRGRSPELFVLKVPGAVLLPSPDAALTNLLRLALLKLPYLVRGSQGMVTGRPLFDITSPPTVPPPVLEPPGGQRAGIWPLPGGVREYMKTLQDLLSWFDETPRTKEEFYGYLDTRYSARGKVSRKAYLNQLRAMGLVEQANGEVQLTEVGESVSEAPDPRKLFGCLEAGFTGVLESLVISDELGPITLARAHEVLGKLLGAEWATSAQTMFRRNWLLSLGLTERQDEGDLVSVAGKAVLCERAVAAQSVRLRLRELGFSTGGGDTDDEDAIVEPAPDVRVALDAATVQPHLGSLILPPHVLDMACAALSSGHHLLLVGPPGTGKTEFALALAAAARKEEYCTGVRTTTASADWTTFDTIGGYALEPHDGHERLVFRQGVFLQAIASEQWVLVDELNRADVDKAFGELMTVLAGRGTTTAFRLPDGRTVSIGRRDEEPAPPDGWTFPVASTFRVIATMNTWDKTSLFRLSYAMQRRFAILHVDVPDEASYEKILKTAAADAGTDAVLEEELVTRLIGLFSRERLLGRRAVGPAVPLDMVKYTRRRGGSADALCEAMILYLLPQLEGLDRFAGREVRKILDETLKGITSPDLLRTLLTRYDELLPETDDAMVG